MARSEVTDFEKLFEDLERLGWEPMVCDTPMTFYDNEVPCGVPNGVGDVVKEELYRLPEELVRQARAIAEKVMNGLVEEV